MCDDADRMEGVAEVYIDNKVAGFLGVRRGHDSVWKGLATKDVKFRRYPTSWRKW